MKNNTLEDTIETLEIKLDHLKNQYEVMKEQYEISTEEYLKTLDDITKVNEKLDQEISLQKKTEEALQESKRKYRELIETSSQMIFTLDTEGNFIFVNNAWKKRMGYSDEEVRKINGFELIHPEDLEIVKKRFGEVFEGNNVENLEFRSKTKNGFYIDIMLNGSPMFDSQGNTNAILGVAADITERKRAAEEIRDSEEKYRSLFENATDFDYTLDLKGNFTNVNRAAEHLTGHTNAELIGMNFRDYTTKDTGKKLSLAFNRIFRTGEPLQDFAFEVIVKDGSSKFFETSVTLLYHGNEIIGFQGSSRDITERKLAEKALMESEEKYRHVIDTSTEAIFVAQEGKLQLVNDRLVGITGYSKEELESRPFSEFIYPDDQEMMAENNRRRLRGETVQSVYPFRFINKNGAVKWAELSAALFSWEGKPATLTMLSDITDRKQGEDMLRMSEEKLSNILYNTRIHMWIFNGERYTYINKEWYNYTGQDPSLPLTVERWTELVHQDDLEKASKIWLKHWEAKTEHDNYFRLRGKNGVYRDFHCHAVPIFNKEGIFVHFQGFNIDITDRKNAEGALRESENRYRALFESAPVSLWEEDFSDLKAQIDELLASGIKDLREYLHEHDEEVFRLVSLVKILDVNNITLDIYQAKSKKELLGSLSKIAGKNALEEHIDSIMSIAEDKTSFERDVVNYTLSGEKLHLLLHMIVHPGYEDTYERVLLSLVDITDRKLLEYKLLKSENRFRAIIENAPFGYYRVGKDGLWQDVNPTWERMHGYSREDVIGKSFEITQPEEAKEQARELVKHVLSGETITGEFGRKRKDGEIKHQSFNIQPVYADKEVIAIEGFINDITERKKAEEELRKREAQLSNAMEIAKLGYWEYDVANDLFTFNDHFYAIFRTTAEKVGGYKMSSAQYAEQFIHPDDKVVVGIETRKAIETIDPHFSRQLEHRIIYANGEIGYIAVRFFIVKDEKGRTIKTYGANQDITERKEAEEKIKASLAEKEILLKEIHHRVKNNMQVISSLLAQQAGKIEDKKYRDIYYESINRIRAIAGVHELLYQSDDFSHINFQDYISKICDNLSTIYLDYSRNVVFIINAINIDLDIDNAIPCGLIINELVTNSLKHGFPDTRKGTITITMKQAKNKKIELTVCNNGVGIPETFDWENTDSLGLHIVKLLAKVQLEGTIELIRTNGTEFKITFKRG